MHKDRKIKKSIIKAFLQDWRGKALLLFVLILGLILLIIHTYFIAPLIHEKGKTFSEFIIIALELVREIGMACVIAFFLAVIIEFYSTKRLQSETTKKVIEDLVKGFLPESIWKELLFSVFPQRVIRKDWKMKMEIKRGHDTSTEYISTTTVSYILDGFSEYDEEYLLSGELFRQEIGKDDSGRRLPRFISIKLGDILYDENLSNLVQILQDDDFKFEKIINSKQGINFPVSLTWKEKLTIPNTYVHVHTALTENITVKVKYDKSLNLKFVVEALHPDPDKMKYSNNTWTFNGGFITGQGIKMYIYK